MRVTIDHTDYELEQDYRDNDELRGSFNALVESTFGINFEQWYANNYWGDNYSPYSLMHNNKIVSNVSISKMEIHLENQVINGIQIGTVMTHEDYRHRGLNRFLLELILKEWEDKSDLIYLFANDSVLDFYPKFNFKKANEYQHVINISSTNNTSELKKLDIDNNEDLNLLLKTLANPNPISKITVPNNTSLIMFYCLYFKKNNIYYLEQLDAIVIADFKDDILVIDDIYSKSPINLKDAIMLIANSSITNVKLGFTPLDDTNFQSSLLEDGDTLFVWKNCKSYFEDKKWRFPLLSHA